MKRADHLTLAVRPGEQALPLEEWLRRLGEAILRLERLPVPAAPAPSPEDPAA